MVDIKRLIHAVDPYANFESGPDDLQGWGGHVSYFTDRIIEAKPRLIVEVGTWKGLSACKMGEIVNAIETTADYVDDPDHWSRSTQIVCVDTWLGATEFWTKHDDPKRYQSLRLKNGYPQVYYTFLSNVVNRNLEHRIVPFPQASTNAARFFRRNGIKADLIYIDGSHEYDDVLADLEAWYPVLSENGVMFGDDYCEYWCGVMKAVDEFAYNHDLTVEHVRMENKEGAPSDYWRFKGL